MAQRTKWIALVCGLLTGCMESAVAEPPLESTGGMWRAPGSAAPASTQPDSPGMQPVAVAQRAPIAKVTAGNGTLPNDQGQVWREYDITPYTLRVTSTARPEQAIVDWILRETGYEAWHSEPLGILSANGRTLRVYHTPEMQAVVGEIIDRFVNTEAETHAFGMRIVTLNSPNWRAKMQRVLKPVPVQTQGVQAWLLSKEDASMLINELNKRTDFREHSSPHLLVHNGQSTVVSTSRPRNYTKNVSLRPEMWPGFEPEIGQINEGFSIEFKPLLSLDSSTIDAVLKCNLDQVEKFHPVMIDVPTPAAPRQRTQVDVPQMMQSRFAEKFHWPVDMVLVIGFGVLPSPTPPEPTAVKIPLVTPPDHVDALLFVESRGLNGKPPSVTQTLPPGTTVRRF